MEDSVKKKIDKFFSKYPRVHLKKKSILIKPEEPLLYIYNIHSGFVRSYSVDSNGMILTINIYKPYSFFPITETLAEITNTYYFEAITDVVLSKVPTQKVHEFVKNDSEVLFDLTKRISSGLEGFMIRTQYLIRSSALQKISLSLILLAKRFGENIDGGRVKIPLPQTHDDIANLAGVSRETASIELKKLQKKGLVSIYKKTYIINDFDKLKEESILYFEDHALPLSF